VANKIISLAAQGVTGVITVSSEHQGQAIAYVAGLLEVMNILCSRLKIIVEPAGAVAFAPICSGKLDLPDGAKVVHILSDGNMDIPKLCKVLTAFEPGYQLK
jgi:hypothetical protein